MKKLLSIVAALLFVFYAGAQTPERITIKGIVTSSETKEPMPGASITIKGARKGGVATDAKGNYTIKINKGQTLVFSFVGFDPVEYKPSGSETHNVTLEMRAIQSDDDVVVVGYGTRKKSHLTGAVAKLTNENLQQIPVGRADLALLGKLAGVSIQMTDAQAGAEPEIQIRSATSVTAGSQPLIVIDGYPVPTDLSSLDMNDIESIEVLKDAASAAIYGSRGGNGVILITTKSGKQGKAKVTINVATGVKQVYRNLDFYSLDEWEQFVRDDNKGTVPALAQQYIDQARVFDAGIDAQDVVFRNVNFHNLQAGVSGNNNIIKYYVSGSAILDNGVMVGNDYKKYNLRAGFEVKAAKNLTVGITANPSYAITYNIPVTIQEAFRNLPTWMPVYSNAVTSAATGKPIGSFLNQKDFDPARNLNYTGTKLSEATTNNGLIQLQGIDDKKTQFRNIYNAFVNYDFSKSWSFRATLGYYSSRTTRDYFKRSWAQADPVIDGEIFARSTSQIRLTETNVDDLLSENYVTFKKVINKHDINVVAGASVQSTYTNYFNGQVGNLASDEIPTLNAGTMQVLTSDKIESTLASFYTRANYAYDNKYLLSASYRADGASVFGQNNRWAGFKAGSIGWRISREKFFPSNDVLSELKIRASYGETGNKNINDYLAYANLGPSYAVLGNEATPGFQWKNFSNFDLGWEKTNSANYGIDLGFINNRINLSLEYFNTNTNKLILNLPIAASTGASNYTLNQGSVQTRGFEFDLSAKIIANRDFKWDVSVNGYTNKVKLTDFGGQPYQINVGDDKRANYFLTQVGSPLVQYYGYIADSSVSLQGTNYWPVGVRSIHQYARDVNGDGKISDSDRVVLGNPYPKFNWGLTSSFSYKQFDISITMQGSHGAKVFNIDPYYFETQFGVTGSTAFEKQGIDKSRLVLKTETSALLQDASFWSVRNVNIGYVVPSKFVKRLKLQRVRAYASASNLFYHFADGYSSYNPEANNAFSNDPLRRGYQRGAAPIARTITFGLNLDF